MAVLTLEELLRQPDPHRVKKVAASIPVSTFVPPKKPLPVPPKPPKATDPVPPKACSLEVKQAADKLVALNSKLMTTFLGTKAVLDFKLRTSCTTSDEKINLMNKIKWDEFSDYVESHYANKVLIPCIHKMVNDNKIDSACIQAAVTEAEQFEKRNDDILKQIETACPAAEPDEEASAMPAPPPKKQKKDKKKQDIYNCNNQKISPAMQQWLANTKDKLTDKRLLCYLKGNINVKIQDKIGAHTVYQIDQDAGVVGIAIPKEEEEITQGSVGWIGMLLQAGIQMMQHMINIILTTITLLVRLARCGVSFVINNLWMWKFAAIFVMMALLGYGAMNAGTFVQYIKDYSLQHVGKIVQLVQPLCNMGMTSFTSMLVVYFVMQMASLLPGGREMRFLRTVFRLTTQLFYPMLMVTCFAIQLFNFSKVVTTLTEAVGGPSMSTNEMSGIVESLKEAGNTYGMSPVPNTADASSILGMSPNPIVENLPANIGQGMAANEAAGVAQLKKLEDLFVDKIVSTGGAIKNVTAPVYNQISNITSSYFSQFYAAYIAETGIESVGHMLTTESWGQQFKNLVSQAGDRLELGLPSSVVDSSVAVQARDLYQYASQNPGSAVALAATSTFGLTALMYSFQYVLTTILSKGFTVSQFAGFG